MRSRETSPFSSILVVRHRAGGDLLLTTPAIRALRAGLPRTRIDVLVARGMGSLLTGNADVNRVIRVNRKSLFSQAWLYVRVALGRYDVVLDLVSNPHSALLTRLSGAHVRVGYDIPGRRAAYTVRIPREPLSADGRPVLRYAPEAALDMVRALGLESRGLELRFEVQTKARERIGAWLAKAGLPEPVEGAMGGAVRPGSLRPLIACLPIGSWPSKTWAPERFAEAMDIVAERGTVLWLWGPGERDRVEACRAKMRRPSVLAPATDWQGLGALLDHCAVFVGNDSGPKHVAAALGIPTVTVFGPTNPATWHPPDGPHQALFAEGLDCLFCNANRCPLPGDRHMRCMRDVTAERVAAATLAAIEVYARPLAAGAAVAGEARP